MPHKGPTESRKALIAAGVRPSSLIPPRRIGRRLATVGVVAWLLVVTALAVGALLRPAGTSEAMPTEGGVAGLSEAVLTETAVAWLSVTPTETAAATLPTDGATATVPIAAGTPTATATPELILEMSVSPESVTVPADGHTTVAITVNVRSPEALEVAEGWSVRFWASAGEVVPAEALLSLTADGRAVAEAQYTPPAGQGDTAHVDVTLHDDAGELVDKQEVVVALHDEALRVVWRVDGRDVETDAPVYVPAVPVDEGAPGLTFRLARADGGEVVGTYTVTVMARGGTIDGRESAQVEVAPGDEPVINFQPAPGATDFGVEVALPDSPPATVQVIPIWPAGEIAGRLDPEGLGLAVCGEVEGEEPPGALTLSATASFIEGETTAAASETHLLLVSYEIVAGDDVQTPLFVRGADKAPWPPGESLVVDAAVGANGRATVELVLHDGDDLPSEAGPFDIFADAPGLARFVFRDVVSAVQSAPVLMPVGVRRVRLVAPKDVPADQIRLPVRLDSGVDYQFSTERYSWPENPDAVLYTSGNSDVGGVRVLAPFWVRAVYFTSNADGTATLHVAAPDAGGRSDIIPASASIEWFNAVVEQSDGNVFSAEEVPDVLFSYGTDDAGNPVPVAPEPFDVLYFGETYPHSVEDNHMHRVYSLGEAPQGALAVWPEPCPRATPTPEPTETSLPTLAPPPANPIF